MLSGLLKATFTVWQESQNEQNCSPSSSYLRARMKSESPTVAFHTLGCKLNFAETSTIARQLRDNGFKKVEFETGADLYVINTCSVTDNADKECRQLIRKALAQNADAFITVVGCYAQLRPEEVAKMEGVDLVLGANEKFNLAGFLNDLNKKSSASIHSCEIENVHAYTAAYAIGDRTRAFLKVQDGCDYTCSYCTIPMARGASRSDTISNIVEQAKQIAQAGVKEIVLTGVNIGDFGAVSGSSTIKKSEENFLQLITALDEVEGIERFRISSIEPNLLNDQIIRFVAASKRFAAHFHIPLQSGSDRILKLMRRRYLRGLYADRVALIRSTMPHCCIGVDVITGFPGETEADFQETYQFLQELEVSYFHVFTYSERPGTDAMTAGEAVPMSVRKQRNKMLRILSAKKQHAFYHSQIGTVRKVIFESELKDGWIYGHTDNYVKTGIPGNSYLINQLLDIELASLTEDGIVSGKSIIE